MITKNIFKKSICLIMALILMFSLVITAGAKKTNKIHAPKYSFTCMDGSTIGNPQNNGKTTLMIFFAEGCGFSAQLISELAVADWIDAKKLSVMAIGYGIADKTRLKKYADTYAKNSKNIKFCLDNDSSLWELLQAVGTDGQIAVPIVFVIDNGGKIVDFTTGGISSSTVRETLTQYVPGLKKPKKIKLSIKGTLDYEESFAVLDLINKERAKAGLKPLKMDKKLLDAAMKRAEENIVYYDHKRPDGSTFNTVDTSFSDMGENIAIGYHNAQEVMNGWMNSPGHKANILDPDYKSVGVGVFYQNGQKSWSQEFSSQNPTAVATKTPNQTKLESVEFLSENLKLKLSRSKESLSIGETDTIYAYINPWDESPQQTVVDNSCLTYKTDNPKVATVSSVGAITPVGVGTTKLTVSLKDSSFEATVPITVYPQGQAHEENKDSNTTVFIPTATEEAQTTVTQPQKPVSTPPTSQTTVSIVTKPAGSTTSSAVTNAPSSKPQDSTTASSKAPTSSAKPSSSTAKKPAANSKPTSSVVSSEQAVSGLEESIDSSVIEESSEDVASKDKENSSEEILTIGAEEQQKPLNVKLIIIIASAVVILAGGAVGTFFILKRIRIK